VDGHKATHLVVRRAAWVAMAAVLLLGSTAQGMYDPHHGRWFQRDPLGVRPDAPRAQVVAMAQYKDGVNTYEYVRSASAVLLDSDGWQSSQPSSQPQPDRSKVCCRYEKGQNLPHPPGATGFVNVGNLNRHRWQKTRRPCPSDGNPKCACLRGFKEYDTRDQKGYGSWAAIKGASWGKCCGCTIKLMYDNTRGWDITWHGFLVIDCPDGKYFLTACPNDLSHPLSCDVDVVPSGPESRWVTHSSCKIDCGTVSRYLKDWRKLGKGGGWYIPPVGSWWWPKAALFAICNDGDAFHDDGDETVSSPPGP